MSRKEIERKAEQTQNILKELRQQVLDAYTQIGKYA